MFNLIREIVHAFADFAVNANYSADTMLAMRGHYGYTNKGDAQ